MGQRLLRHTHAVIAHPQYDPVILKPSRYPDKPFPFLIFNAVIDRVFHNGLDDQLYDLHLQHHRFHIYLVFQFIYIPHLLDGQVTSGIFYLLLQRDHFVFVADALPQQLCQRGCHQHHIPDIAALRHPDNGIQRIIQKMGVDLRLQGI